MHRNAKDTYINIHGTFPDCSKATGPYKCASFAYYTAWYCRRLKFAVHERFNMRAKYWSGKKHPAHNFAEISVWEMYSRLYIRRQNVPVPASIRLSTPHLRRIPNVNRST